MHPTWTRLLFGGLLVAGLVMGRSVARAADTEQRDFTIQVDGKPAGDYHMTITRADDGTVTMDAQSQVRVTVLRVPVYTYHYKGHEVYKDGKLQQFHATGDEKGNQFAVHVNAASDGLHVNSGGPERTASADDWLTSCWQLDQARCNQPVTLLGCATGTEVPTKLELVGTESLTLAGQPQQCTHCRVVNGTPHDLWYDAQGRLVKQSWQAGSHKTVIELTAVRH